MRILLTNDDGIHAEGLAVLERIARKLSDDVWVVAPETDQSGLAHSLTLLEPLRLRQIDARHFALRGTPTDCVIMGVRHVLPGAPDLVLSGVNSGANMADDVTYSGTVAGAMEGTLLGVRAIALSQEYEYAGDRRIVPWETAEAHAPELIGRLMEAGWPEGVLLNLNFPNCAPEEVKGVRVTAQGKLSHDARLDERRDGRGFPYFWLHFGRGKAPVADDSDIAAIRSGCISMTPLHLDLTAHKVRAELGAALGVEA
ncbi:5'-nucleotidase surE [Brucella abortus 01-4165]|uniref:5'-nucleotidase SurE n=5 Tax=Brucella abortus TaxID=235 RepID=SURE_BRUA2|nr:MULTISPECIES: 5'/3'-nucleotidase SurE [Brucella]B2S5B9.1 RecName: Full=5'-nucleotidase SurE; AltName: Full=Nucleoside 5'-monophosphate phosphohydrolase [Brucella abortus S19]Q2YNM5.1 RecName: Full=5'-nucleotidase SurE; AltName: Full=Nucleoside 5'-monophosphate phosphohydrolase [Brucella abortus 2308]Q57DM1.1 RecName: Full=5'-nucleotidase SurE; AltName: Full=Nucleoside 5'-monophosphate phosphohydrolase [Brucella abortus bv. 1 str. 9-941]KFH23331.1 stationary phase survival protein SurE [Bruce